MNIGNFFKSQAMALPRDRLDEDFELYLKDMFQGYLDAIKSLDPQCHLCSRIQSEAGNIDRLSGWIKDAVRHYLAGKPSTAYQELVKGIDFVYLRLQKLISKKVSTTELGALYRLADTKGKKPPKERLFHTPFNLRHKVRQHRYGIPGFPCLYLGGSLELCVEECRVQPTDLSGVAVAEFALRDDVRILDFGYRPEVLARPAAGSAMSKPGSNPPVEDFIVNYATCWPLIAASSIRVLHDGEPFVYEYIIPQMILQWAMSSAECDGIRFFSTRFLPGPEAIKGTANYVFPATHDIGAGKNFSQRLKDLFELTEPLIWGPACKTLRQDARDIQQRLNAFSKAPI